MYLFNVFENDSECSMPFIIIFFGFLVKVYTLSSISRSTDGKDDTDLKPKLWGRTLKVSIIFLYLVLPGVSQSIFDALKCEEFKTNDKDALFIGILSQIWLCTVIRSWVPSIQVWCDSFGDFCSLATFGAITDVDHGLKDTPCCTFKADYAISWGV